MGMFPRGKSEVNETSDPAAEPAGDQEAAPPMTPTPEPAAPSGFVRDIVNSSSVPTSAEPLPGQPLAVEPPMAPWDPRFVDLYTHPHAEVEPESDPRPLATQEYVTSLAIANGLGASAVGRPKRIGAFGIAVMVLAVAIIGFGTYIFLRKITDNFTIFDDETVTAVGGAVGSPTQMPYGAHTFEVTVTQPISQPSAAWSSFKKPSSGRYLLMSVSITRTDDEGGTAQVAFYDWKFTVSDGQVVQGVADAGGYGPLLSTVGLKSKDTKTGMIAFDTAAADGTLSLTSPLGTWGTWPVTATKFLPTEGVLGEGLLPQPGSPPFSITVANPRWLPAGDPAISIAPNSGNFLVVDLVAAVDPQRVAPGTSLYVSDKNFRFISTAGQQVPANSGRVVGSNPIKFGANASQIGNSIIAFDVAPGPGTIEFLNADGSVLATWEVTG